MAGRSGALSIKPSEGSRSRVRRTRPMDFQSIFRWESLPEAGFGKTLLLMLIDVAVTAFSWIILTRGGPLFKTTVQTTVQTCQFRRQFRPPFQMPVSHTR